MADPPVFLSCIGFARLTGYGRQRVNEFCLEHPGFGFQAQRPLGWWRIPFDHAVRLMNGETVAEIAARPTRPRLDDLPSKTSNRPQEGVANAP